MLIGPCSTLGLLERRPLNCSITGTMAPKFFNYEFIISLKKGRQVEFQHHMYVYSVFLPGNPTGNTKSDCGFEFVFLGSRNRKKKSLKKHEIN